MKMFVVYRNCHPIVIRRCAWRVQYASLSLNLWAKRYVAIDSREGFRGIGMSL